MVAASGALGGKTRRALDSTVLEDAVATQDTVTRLVAAVRRVARSVPGGEWLVTGAATRSGHDYRRPGKPEIAWDDAAAREQLIDALVRDALAVLAAVTAAEEAGELVVPGGGGGRGRAARAGRRPRRRAGSRPAEPGRGGHVAGRAAGRPGTG